MPSDAAAASLVPFTDDAMPFHDLAGADVCLQLTPPSPDVKINPREGYKFVHTARALPSPEDASELQLPAGSDTHDAFVQL
jgi:hypothetical protein